MTPLPHPHDNRLYSLSYANGSAGAGGFGRGFHSTTDIVSEARNNG